MMKHFKNIFLFLFVILFSSCSFSAKKTISLYETNKSKEYDVIIVPGVPFENGGWSRTMRARVLWSKFLYDKGIAKQVMYSGSAVYSPYIEAEIMALYGEAIGLSKDDIYTENFAEHSTENLYYGYQYAKKLGFEKVALASDPFQTKLLKRFAKKIDPNIGIMPMVYDSVFVLSNKIGDPEIDYESLKQTDFISIKDREGFWKRLQGTRGKNLKEGLYD